MTRILVFPTRSQREFDGTAGAAYADDGPAVLGPGSRPTVARPAVRLRRSTRHVWGRRPAL